MLQTQCKRLFSFSVFINIYKHFYNCFFLHFTFVCCVLQSRGIVQDHKEENVGGSQNIVRAAYEVQRSPADVINMIMDQQLLQQLVHLVEEWVFILGREMYYSLVWNRSNKLIYISCFLCDCCRHSNM